MFNLGLNFLRQFTAGMTLFMQNEFSLQAIFFVTSGDKGLSKNCLKEKNWSLRRMRQRGLKSDKYPEPALLQES